MEEPECTEEEPNEQKAKDSWSVPSKILQICPWAIQKKQKRPSPSSW